MTLQAMLPLAAIVSVPSPLVGTRKGGGNEMCSWLGQRSRSNREDRRLA
jgi:hypothetical protein